MSTVDEMNENGISIGDACKYSGTVISIFKYNEPRRHDERLVYPYHNL